ncbi:MAG: DUF1016 N-terminal domain-containing protein [Thermodesulfovibrionales bacterium]
MVLKKTEPHTKGIKGYNTILSDVAELLESARRVSARATNAIMTATYWEIGRRIVEHEQRGRERAGYGEELLLRLSSDLTARFGKGFSRQNLQRIREFYLIYPPDKISSTLSSISEKVETSRKCPTLSSETMQPVLPKAPMKSESLSRKFSLAELSRVFPLPWSDYVLLLSVKNSEGRSFYESEALRGGWSVRQLERQINTQFYERTALSRDKAAMLKKGAKPLPEDAVTPEEEIKDPFVLEFLGLKDEYSENDMEMSKAWPMVPLGEVLTECKNSMPSCRAF